MTVIPDRVLDIFIYKTDESFDGCVSIREI